MFPLSFFTSIIACVSFDKQDVFSAEGLSGTQDKLVEKQSSFLGNQIILKDIEQGLIADAKNKHVNMSSEQIQKLASQVFTYLSDYDFYTDSQCVIDNHHVDGKISQLEAKLGSHGSIDEFMEVWGGSTLKQLEVSFNQGHTGVFFKPIEQKDIGDPTSQLNSVVSAHADYFLNEKSKDSFVRLASKYLEVAGIDYTDVINAEKDELDLTRRVFDRCKNLNSVGGFGELDLWNQYGGNNERDLFQDAREIVDDSHVFSFDDTSGVWGIAIAKNLALDATYTMLKQSDWDYQEAMEKQAQDVLNSPDCNGGDE